MTAVETKVHMQRSERPGRTPSSSDVTRTAMARLADERVLAVVRALALADVRDPGLGTESDQVVRTGHDAGSAFRAALHDTAA